MFFAPLLKPPKLLSSLCIFSLKCCTYLELRILYSAIDQVVPAPHGGSVHVTSVAEGLSRSRSRGSRPGIAGSNRPVSTGRRGMVADVTTAGRSPLAIASCSRRQASRPALKPDAIIERYYNFGGEGMLAAREIGAVAVLEVNAPVVDPPGSIKPWIDRMLIVQPLRRWRDWQCRAADLIVTPSASILPADVPPPRVLETEWGADTDRFHPGARGDVPFSRHQGDTVAIFVSAFRAWHGAIHLVEAIRQLRARGRRDIKAVLIGDGPELSRVRQAAEGLEGVTLTGALPHSDIPASLAAADIGVAPFDIAAHAPLRWEFYWSPLKIFEYMASGLPVIAPRIDRLTRIFRDGREGIFYDPTEPGSLALALERLADPSVRSGLGTAARDRAVDRFSWRSHCQALIAPSGSHAMRILIATDAFPPVSGGSGWSTYELARGLRAKGHHLVVVEPYAEDPPQSYDGFDVMGFPARAPRVPFVRNYFRNERLYRRLATYLSTRIREERIDVIHAQHELTGPASVRAAQDDGHPSVVTVRDYWPLCYWNDLVRDPSAGPYLPRLLAGRHDEVSAAACRSGVSADHPR